MPELKSRQKVQLHDVHNDVPLSSSIPVAIRLNESGGSSILLFDFPTSMQNSCQINNKIWQELLCSYQ